MKNRTNTDERKIAGLYYLVPFCVVFMLILKFINQSKLTWSVEKALEKSHGTLAFKMQWWDHT